MKQITIILSAVIYFTIIIILLRKYSDNHIISFLSGVFGMLGIAFFIYMISDKNHYLKRKLFKK
ncbi:hypothetical protein BC749_10485 [Flavobacterium araucananum]|uniref:Uncharacterized protein n=1 Tax=Flavobacterium araucananum TaxID=946678 RepID=A0A227NFS7_9FLAO|nr:hypothetical protein [Flavobacterium araucananum]OXE96522.1 hypothetical protein B0A64_23915 [Flavobacterium araucananum]PWJ98939.1 hypothetical protein BC749_10485 [Flavobacterium araucananum]